MATFDPRAPFVAEIDRSLTNWRQGDLVLDRAVFAHVVDPSRPLTPAAAEVEGHEDAVVTTECRGLVVLTQTCDIVRPAAERPYVQVAPVVLVPHETADMVARGYIPRYAPIAALEDHVAELDRIMTVEKSLVAKWPRTPGCKTDDEVRRFGQAVARRFARFAFPDDFVNLARPLVDRIKAKHDRNSAEGTALRSLREIRVTASPAWDAERIEVFFTFIRRDDSVAPGGKTWDSYLQEWLARCQPHGRIIRVDGVVLSLDQVTAREYIESDPLDLDNLSAREGTP